MSFLIRYRRVLVCLSLSATVAHCADEIPPGLQAALSSISEQTTLVSRDEIDILSCGDVAGNPSLVLADFNGDGEDDFAAIVRIGPYGDPFDWQGRILRPAAFAFILVVADGGGKYSIQLLESFDSYAPVGVYVQAFSARTVRDRDTGREVALQHPGVSLTFCEKSAALYYLEGNEVLRVQTGD